MKVNAKCSKNPPTFILVFLAKVAPPSSYAKTLFKIVCKGFIFLKNFAICGEARSAIFTVAQACHQVKLKPTLSGQAQDAP